MAAEGVSQKLKSEAVAVSAVIDGFNALGSKASFTQLYNLRRELFNASFTFKGRGGGDQLDTAVNLLDNILTKETIESAALLAGKSIDEEGFSLLMKAADELPEARKFFRVGKTAIEDMQSAASLSGLDEAVKSGTIMANVDFLKNIVRNGSPESLTRTLAVIKANVKPGQDGAAVAESFRKKLASEWLSDAVARTSTKADDPLSFKGSAFSKAIEDLGSTGRVLFGDSYDDVVRLSEQIKRTTVPGKTSLVDVESALTGMGDAAPVGIKNALEEIKRTQTQIAQFEQSSLLKSIANNEAINPLEAAQIIATPSTKAADITKVMNSLDDSGKEQVRQFFMTNILDDFGSDALIKGESLKKFSKSLVQASESGRLTAIYGKEMADDMAQFGRILELNARTVDGGDLIAANIAASPLENIMDIIRLSVTANLLTHAPVYKSVLRDYQRLSGKLSTRDRASALGKIIGTAIKQSPGQLSQEGVREADRQIRSVVDSSGLGEQLSTMQNQMSQPNLASDLASVDITQSSAPTGANTIRQQAAASPAVAQALGIRGSTAGLLGIK